MAFRVLGIDPGLTRLGYGVVEQDANRVTVHLDSGVIRSSPKTELQTRLHSIGNSLRKLILDSKPDSIALERVFAQQNLNTVMGVAQISGLVFYLAAVADIPVVLYTPTQVKAAVTGYGKANKQQVATMTAKHLSLSTIAGPADTSDALALALCHIWSANRIQILAKTETKLTPAQEIWLAAERQSRR